MTDREWLLALRKLSVWPCNTRIGKPVESSADRRLRFEKSPQARRGGSARLSLAAAVLPTPCARGRNTGQYHSRRAPEELYCEPSPFAHVMNFWATDLPS